MKKTTTLLSVLFIACAAFAPEGTPSSTFKATFGPTYELPKKHVDLGFVGDPTDGLVQVSFKQGSDLTLQKLDSKYAVTKTQEVDISKMPSNFISDRFMHFGNKHLWFYSTWDKKAEKEHLFSQQIDVKNGKMVGEQEVLSATKLHGDLISLGGYHFEKANKYHFYTSTDTSKLLIAYTLEHTTRDDSKSKEVIGFNVFDTNMKKLWNKEVTMPYTEEMMDNVDYTVDNEGNAYLLAKVFDGSRKIEKGATEPNYHYELIRFSNGSGSVKTIPVKLSKFINEIYITENQQGELVLSGFYSAVRGNSSDGVYIVKIDKEGNVSNVKKGFYEFPNEILKQYVSAREKSKLEKKEQKDDKDLEVYDLEMRNVLFNSDGSMLITGEEYFTRTVTYSNGNSTYSRTYYYYYDILVMKISAAGEMEWCRKIPKRQVGTGGRRTMSFDFEEYNGEYYFFYTDNVKNLNITTDKVPERHADGAGGFLVYTKIDKGGHMSKYKMFDYREKKVQLFPAEFQRVSNNELIDRAFDGKVSQVVSIKMN